MTQHAYLYSPKMVTNGYKPITRLHVLAALIGPRVSVQRDRWASAAKKAAAAAKKAGGIILMCVVHVATVNS